MSDQPTNPSNDKPSLTDAFIADSLESRSASKTLLQQPPLSESQYGEPQRWKRGKFSASEYRNSLVKCSEEQMKFNDDPVNNRRRYNNASLRVKVTYKERVAALDRALANESLTARCVMDQGRQIEPEDHSVDAATLAFNHAGIVRKPHPQKEEGEE